MTTPQKTGASKFCPACCMDQRLGVWTKGASICNSCLPKQHFAIRRWSKRDNLELEAAQYAEQHGILFQYLDGTPDDQAWTEFVRIWKLNHNFVMTIVD